MTRALFLVLALWACGLTSRAQAQVYAYPVPWPKSGGGTIVAVPVRDATVSIHHRMSAPQGSGWDTPFTAAPERRIDLARAGEPVVLRVPEGAPPIDQDDYFVLISSEPLALSASDDERYNPGSPDRLYFFPATTGSYRGREFYGYSAAGWFANRLRIVNLGSASNHAEVSAWDGAAWVPVAALDVAADGVGVLDPPDEYADTAYRVTTSDDALVLEGYMADNATLPAVDLASGGAVGTDLWGYGHSYSLRAVSDLDYTVDARPEEGGAWVRVASGTLRADELVTGELPSMPSRYLGTPDEVNPGDHVRIRTTRGRAWAIVGTVTADWNGYFFPAQAEAGCVFGARFLTTGRARVVVVLPNTGTRVSIFDEVSGAALDTYTSRGPWELHHFFDDARLRVEVTGGPAATLMIGDALGGGPCSRPGPTGSTNCGILEGGFSVPALGGFQCSGGATALGDCGFDATRCTDAPPPVDGGVAFDAGAMESDAGAALDAGATLDGGVAFDAGGLDGGGLDGGGLDGGGLDDGSATDSGAIDEDGDLDGGTAADASGAGVGAGSAGCGCRAGSPRHGRLGLGVLGLLGLFLRARRGLKRTPRPTTSRR